LIAGMNTEFTVTQKRALAVVTIISLLFAGYFLRSYFILIVVAAVGAYLFTPLFGWFGRRLGSGMAATCTLLTALAVVIVPIGLLVLVAIVQISRMVTQVTGWVARTNLSDLGEQSLQVVNKLLARLPFLHITVTAESLRKTMASVAQKAGEWFLHFVQDTAGGLFGAVTSAIIFLYVFVALLTNREELLTLIRQLNPLGEDVTDLYLRKMGSMVRGTVNGQFVIALCQGVAGAASVYVAGFHHGFFIFAILLTALSIIPLGGGIVTIPFGIGMIFYGNIIGGGFVVAWHLLVVTNLDNFLRPILVPRDARLNPALMLLAVFAGIAMFGPWGIVIGPVLMIVIVTTIGVYLAVYKGVELQELDDQDSKPGWLTRWKVREQLNQPLLEELDDSLARFVGRLTVHLADLQGQHRMRCPGKAMLIAWAGVDLDHLERVAEPLFERGEPFAGRHQVLAESQTQRAHAFLGGAVFECVQLDVAEAGIAALARGQRERCRRLAEHRCQHAFVDRGGQRESTGETLADHTDAFAGCRRVEVTSQCAQEIRYRPVLVGRERGEFPCHTNTSERIERVADRDRTARLAEQRRYRHGKTVVHQVISQPEYAWMDARHLGDQHHAGSVATAVDVVGVPAAGERFR
jgi:predicted PurR-regulated permease PerM